MLYLVPTPIGNLGDITERAIQILKSVDIILAEDTRNSGKLLKHFEIQTKMRAYHAHNEHLVTADIIESLSKGTVFALITDAGTPGISDPGYLLTKACHETGITVQCLPGATAFVPALAVSGIPSDKFHFEGFLPHKKGRQTRLKYLATLPNTFVLYESPYRLLKCLTQLAEHCGSERIASVSREISKLHEEASRGTLQELHDMYNERPSIKGEIVIVVSGSDQ